MMMMTKAWVSRLGALGIAVGFLTPARPASAGLLGVAGNYNEFVLGNSTRSNVDAQGAVAVGGTATFTSFTTGSGFANQSLPVGLAPIGSGGATGLVVGGDLIRTGGGTTYGNAFVGGNASIATPTINGSLNVVGNVSLTGGGSVSGGVVFGGTYTGPSYITSTRGTASVPVDFAATGVFLKGLSDDLATRAGTSVSGSSLVFQAGSAGLNVFQVTADALSAASSISVNVGSAFTNATILINVIGNGSSAATLSGGFSLNGTGADRVLMNFSGISTLTIAGVGAKSSILAPHASVVFNSAHVDGNLIAGTLDGSGESHLFPNGGTSGTPTLFTGTVPPAAIAVAVPEPSSLIAGLVGTGLAWMAFLKTRGPRR